MKYFCYCFFTILLIACDDVGIRQETAMDIQKREILDDTKNELSLADTIQYVVNEAGNIVLDWTVLRKIDFEERFNESVDDFIFYPIFDEKLRNLEGKKIQIGGYVIPISETGDESILVLSANPYSSCFFCGMAGPETVMDVKLKDMSAAKKLDQDDVVEIEGVLKLNDSDLYYLNYILEGAALVNR